MQIHLDDRKLVKRLLAGKESAFNQFFDENFARLYRFVLTRVSRDKETAKDIVQTTLSRALENIHGYRGEAALFTWLCVIARNEIVNWARRTARYQEHIVLTEDFPEIRSAVDSILSVSADDPHKHFQKYEMSRLIHVALDSLPSRYGNALEWKYIQGYSIKEIAIKLDLSPDAAQSLLARARRSFQEVYSTLVQPLLEEAPS